MDSPTTATTIDLTLSSSDAEMCSSNDNNTSSATKTKIGRHGLERHYKDFKEYLTGDLIGKISATCVLCNETVWHLKNSTSNYGRHLQRKHKAEFDLWSENASRQKNSEGKMQQLTLTGSLSPTSSATKYGSTHPRQIELTRMVFNDFIVGLDMPLSITEKPSFIHAMTIVDPKFRVPSRRSITVDYLPK